MEAVEPFVSLVIYPTEPASQTRAADNLAVLAAQKIRLLPGFLRGRIFVSDDGLNLISIAEWSDRESFEQFRRSEFGQSATQLLANLNPKAYWLRHHSALQAP
jgi:heme-degrading monooxygenase HmoA